VSDGGAGAFVEVASALTRFKLGRGVLWFAAAYLVVTSVSAKASERPFMWFAAVVLALVAGIAGFLAGRKKRSERASLRAALYFIGFVFVALGGALFVIFRKKKGEPELPPPDEKEVDALVAAE
jgi:uncharacterized membrane protein YoaK (UPF0700 family)